MGLLAPLFLAGLAALAGPLIFHLIRRTPRGRQDFSSLMFLRPTPPTLTRRSRLDQVVLLLMRLAALAALAFAFSRPFLRESSLLSLNDLPQRRVAILIDRSASLRRGDLWNQAIAAANAELDELAPRDEVALYAFSDRLEKIVGFDARTPGSNAPAADVVRRALGTLEPTWSAGDLGAALTTLASELDATGDHAEALAEPRLVVVSDFQQGGRIDALQNFEWPTRVAVAPRTVTSKRTTNASLQVLPIDEAAPTADPRVRVFNASDSTRDQFFVRWTTADAPASTEGELAVYVPPGQSRVVRLPRGANAAQADRVTLRGDDHDFDNAFFVSPPRKQHVAVHYLGDDAADDPQGWQYYLRLALGGDAFREVSVSAATGDASPLLATPAPRWVVLTKRLADDKLSLLETYVESGGSLLVVAPDDSGETLRAFFDDLSVAPADGSGSPGGSHGGDEFHLLGEIDFTHPLFSPLANPRYNDFTRIHFWTRREFTLSPGGQTQTLARFDDGAPWLVERALGRGRVAALASGWRPDDGQLAASSKFVALVGGWLDLAAGAPPTQAGTLVDAPIALPRDRAGEWIVKAPDGSRTPVAADAEDFREARAPGIYDVGAGDAAFRAAVNLAPSESDTAPLALERLEQFGVPLGKTVGRAERLDRIRQERDVELESRQQIWRWLVVAGLAFLILETAWAARATRASAAPREAAA